MLTMSHDIMKEFNDDTQCSFRKFWLDSVTSVHHEATRICKADTKLAARYISMLQHSI